MSDMTTELVTEAEGLDVSDLVAKWSDASVAARKSEHHWPADCLAEAAEVVTRLADRLAAVEKAPQVMLNTVDPLGSGADVRMQCVAIFRAALAAER